jgi:hypothetical protein
MIFKKKISFTGGTGVFYVLFNLFNFDELAAARLQIVT